MKYFTINELTKSNTATQYGIANVPNQEQVKNLTELVEKVLDPLREKYGAPIYVTSGFRSKELNVKVGGVSSSQHLTGQAADITVKTKQGNKQLFELIQALNLPFDQLIDEKNFSWIHVSYRENPRKQVLHL